MRDYSLGLKCIVDVLSFIDFMDSYVLQSACFLNTKLLCQNFGLLSFLGPKFFLSLDSYTYEERWMKYVFSWKEKS